MNKTILFSVLPAVSLFGSVQHGNGKEKKPLNIVFIAVDDMNNWVGALGGQAKTPNIDKIRITSYNVCYTKLLRTPYHLR